MRIRIINDLTEFRPSKPDDTAKACEDWIKTYGDRIVPLLQAYSDGICLELQAILEKLKKN